MSAWAGASAAEEVGERGFGTDEAALAMESEIPIATSKLASEHREPVLGAKCLTSIRYSSPRLGWASKTPSSNGTSGKPWLEDPVAASEMLLLSPGEHLFRFGGVIRLPDQVVHLVRVGLEVKELRLVDL